jgi:hypothetical protein
MKHEKYAEEYEQRVYSVAYEITGASMSCTFHTYAELGDSRGTPAAADIVRPALTQRSVAVSALSDDPRRRRTDHAVSIGLPAREPESADVG